MGFRNFHNFNLAMFGKFGRRLISEPDALVCTVLKAKYFSKGNFLNAKLGQCPKLLGEVSGVPKFYWVEVLDGRSRTDARLIFGRIHGSTMKKTFFC